MAPANRLAVPGVNGLMRFKNLIQDTHRFRTLSFPFAFLLLTRRFGIMRDFAGYGLRGLGNETLALRNQSVPKS